jgi:Domain of unknown function (DUF1841)
MFNPSQEQVRRFFCDTFRKYQDKQILSPMEDMAARWIVEHPEYHAALSDVEAAVNMQFSVENGQTNPFLHLSMHLTIAEQVSINQPVGIRPAWQDLRAKLGSEHDAAHQIMESLGTMIWTAQRNKTAPDGQAYVNDVQRRAST